MTANDWFRLPESGAGTEADPSRPDLLGYDVDGWTGQKSHPDGGSKKWVVRVYADAATLDTLAAEAGAQRLDSVPVDALNQMLNQQRDAAGWERGFNIGGN